MAATTSWNSLNYTGELFLTGAQMRNKPFLSMIGHVTGSIEYGDVRFPVSQPWTLRASAQPAITETASLTAKTPETYTRGQDFNTTQIFNESVSVSYAALSQPARLGAAGLAQVGDQPVNNEFDFQLDGALQQIYNDMNYSCINGVYQAATSAGVAAKTRGIIPATTTNAVAAGSVDLSTDLMDALWLAMANGGAKFMNPVIFASALDVQRLNNLYGFAEQSRTIGGTNVKTIVSPLVGDVAVVWDVDIPAGTLLCADLAVCSPVHNQVAGKGTGLFLEDLSKTGAADAANLYGQFGMNYGEETYHGKITGLTTS